MDFNIQENFNIFNELLKKRPEIIPDTLKQDLKIYYLPYVQKLTDLKNKKNPAQGILIGVSAIQGTGKTTQGEVLEILLSNLGFSTISLSIDDYYLSHEQLNELREFDPRYIRRGVTHDIYLAIENLKKLINMKDGMVTKVPLYDKGAQKGDGDRVGWKDVSKKPDFIFFDGWMLGVRRVENESVFDSGLPALDTSEHILFAKDINRKLDEYLPLWNLLDFLTVLYVPNYQISLKWRNQAEEVLRAKGEGMTEKQIEEFVYYFWRSVHPAIHIKNLAHDEIHTNQVVVINDDHTVKEVLTPAEAKIKYP